MDGNVISWYANDIPKPDGSRIEVRHSERAATGRITQSQITRRWESGRSIGYVRFWWNRYGDVILTLDNPNRRVLWDFRREKVTKQVNSGMAGICVRWCNGLHRNFQYHRRGVFTGLSVNIFLTLTGFANKLDIIPYADNEQPLEGRAARVEALIRELRYWQWRKAARRFIPWFRRFKPKQRETVIEDLSSRLLPDLARLIARLP